MYRIILINLLLLSVLSIGFPIPNPLSELTFAPLRFMGIDVSMTPITTDMSMMTDAKNTPLYKKKVHLRLHFDDGTFVDVLPKDLHLYLHKIPIILFYEILGFGGDMPEGRVFLCRSFQRLVDKKITNFSMWTEEKNDRQGLNKYQECHQ